MSGELTEDEIKNLILSASTEYERYTAQIISRQRKQITELEQALAVAQQAQREAEAERDLLQEYVTASDGHYCDGMAMAWSDAQEAIGKQVAAEAAMARAREALERVKWQEELDATCCPTGSYHCIGCYAWRGKKGQPEVHDPKCFVAAALEATPLGGSVEC